MVNIIKKMSKEPEIDVRVAVTGAHLSPEFGMTVKEIIEGPIDISLPASILQKHNDVTIYCDVDAASLLTK